MRTFSAPIIIAALLSLLCWQPASAGTTLFLAVASNFSRPMEEMEKAFTKEAGVEIQSSFASTGKLFAMIENGAPFDIFLAADSRRPENLHKLGLADLPFIYAHGRAVLWTTSLELCTLKEWQQVIRSPQLRQIAIANPETAPYGQVVQKIINTLPDRQNIIQRLVYTQNVGQAFQYAEKVTEAGFTAASFALSQEGKKGCSLPIPEAETVIQKGCVLQRKSHNQAAAAFVSFLEGPQAAAILQKYGYTREQQ